MEEIIRYIIPALVALVGTLIPAFLVFKTNSKKTASETQELIIKQDHELRDQIRLLWEENRKLRQEISELRKELDGR